MREIKCAHCGHWTANSSSHCGHCNHVFFEKEQLELEERKKTELEPMKIPLIQINPQDPLSLKVVKYIIRFHQIVFFSIVSYIAWATAWFAG